jgi:hypothetical protein
MSFNLDLLQQQAEAGALGGRLDWLRGRKKLPWWQQAAMAPGDVLGGIGTLKDLVSDTTLRPALGAAMALTSPVEDRPEGILPHQLAEYQRRRSAIHPLTEFVSETLVDPLSYVGGPIRIGAGALGRLAPRFAPVLSKVASADKAYEEGTRRIVSAATGAVGRTLEKTPVLGTAFKLSPGGKVAKRIDEYMSAVRQAATQGTETFERDLAIATGRGGRLAPETPKAMRAVHAAVWKSIEDRIDKTDKAAGMGGPIHKFVAAHIYETARVEREKINDHAYRMVKNIRDAADPDMQSQLDGAWGIRHNRLMDLAESIGDSLDSLEKMDWTKAEQALVDNPSLFTSFAATVDKAVVDSRNMAHMAARISDVAKKGENATPVEIASLPSWAGQKIEQIVKDYRVDPATGAATPDILADQLAEFRNQIFRSAGRQGRAALTYARKQLDPLAAGSPLGTEAIDTAYGAAESLLRRGYGDLTRAGTSVTPEWMQRIGTEAAETLRSSEAYTDRALASINRARGRILRAAEPTLSTLPLDVAGPARTDMKRLLQVVATHAANPQQVLNDLKRAGVGFEDIDILNDANLPFALKHSVSKQFAAEEGIKSLPVAYTTAVQAWKELALMSVAYNVANLASGLFFGQKAGVDPVDTLRALSKQLKVSGPAFRAALLRGELPHDMPIDAGLLPLLKQLGRVNAAGEVVMHPSLARSIGTGGETVAGKVMRQTALQRLALPVGVGFGVGTTAAGIMGGQDQNQSLATGIGVGAAAGLGLGRIAALNRVMSGVIESALRTTAYYTTMEASHPAAATTMADAIRAFNPAQVRRLGTAGTPLDAVPDKAAVADWFQKMSGRVSPRELREKAVSLGFREEDANALAGQWSGGIEGLERIGIDVSNSFNFDYEDVPNVTRWLRDSGVMPFVTWQTKALPVMAGILLSNPRYYILIDEYKRATDKDIAEAGLTPRFHDKMRLDLGDYISESIFGRPGTAFVNPLATILPIMDAIPDDNRPEYGTSPVSQMLNKLQPLGVSLSPFVSIPLATVGATDEYSGNLLGRPSQAIEAATGVSPEAPVREVSRRIARATGAERPEVITDTAAHDAQIQQRIADMYLESGKKGPLSGEYLRALDDPKSAIWQRAAADVQETRRGTTGIGLVAPVRPAFLSRSEAVVRAERKAAGLDAESKQSLREQPITPAEAAAAKRVLAQGGNKTPTEEDISTTVNRARMKTRYEKAGRSNPTALAYENIGVSEGAKDARAWAKYNEFRAKLPKNSKAATAAMQEFLRQNPDVKRVLQEYRSTLF